MRVYHTYSPCLEAGGAGCPKIDHIAISEHVRALNINIDRHALDGRYPSDHFPVVATIHVPTKKTISTAVTGTERTRKIKLL